MHSKFTLRMLAAALLFVMAQMTVGQSETVTVPDVSGLNVPEAAALLNASGLLLGTEASAPWTPDAAVPENTIGEQSVAAGTTVPAGTVVNVTLLRPDNFAVIYDDNDVTLVNYSGGSVDFREVTFTGLDGPTPSWEATEWGIRFLNHTECAQLWSVPRFEPKAIDGCDRIASWRSTTNPAVHFWTQRNSVTQFSVVQAGVERAVCPGAPPDTPLLRCDFYMDASGIPAPNIDYVYFTYTPDQLIVINQSDDEWLPLDAAQIVNYRADEDGSTFAYGSPTVFAGRSVIGRPNQLAPGQCLRFTATASPGADLPEACHVIAERQLDLNEQFWLSDFGVIGTDDEEYTCTGASPDRRTICVMPR